MAKKTKEELKALSNVTFLDNNTGEIQPAAHRAFINDVLDSVNISSDWTECAYKKISGEIDEPGLKIKVKITDDYAIIHFIDFNLRSMNAAIFVYGVEISVGDSSASFMNPSTNNSFVSVFMHPDVLNNTRGTHMSFSCTDEAFDSGYTFKMLFTYKSCVKI